MPFAKLSLRQRFLIVTSIGVIYVLFAVVDARQTTKRQALILQEIEEEYVEIISKLGLASKKVAQLNFDFYTLLNTQLPELSEGEFYDRAIKQIDRIRQDANELENALVVARDKGFCSDALVQKADKTLSGYYQRMFSTVDLVLVDRKLATVQSMLANHDYLVFEDSVHECQALSRKKLGEQIQSHLIDSRQRLRYNEWSSYIAVALMIGMAWLISTILSRSLRQQIVELKQLNKEVGVELTHEPVSEPANEVDVLNSVISTFKDSLLTLREREQALTRLNAELKASHQLLDQRVAERTAELDNALSRIQVKNLAIEWQATHDSLTELSNKSLLLDRMSLVIGQYHRERKEFAVLLIDLDNFKVINETLGHTVGDELLKLVADRIKGCSRDCDMAARIGGDEFALLVLSPVHENTLAKLATRLIRDIGEPMSFEGNRFVLTASIGICVYPLDGSDPDELFKHADIALYRAKEGGRNTFVFYTREMHERFSARLEMERQIKIGLEKDEFTLFFQPKICLKTGNLSGAEALIRWNSSAFGFLGPDQFIPVAEETGLIIELGEWVIKTACACLAQWQAQGINLIPIAVNVSPFQFSSQPIERLLKELFATYHLDANLLEIEVTESLSMDNPDATIGWMKGLNELGVTIAIDDFGTGYSNLSYLRQFPVDVLKIDRSFISHIISDSQCREITRTIIQLAHGLNLKCVAEGVETQGQLALLVTDGCDFVQGYYFSKPLPGDEFLELLKSPAPWSGMLVQEQESKGQVLFVDDDPHVLASLRRLLRDSGLKIFLAQTQASGYELLALHSIGVVVCDQMMDEGTGIDFLANVKRLHPTCLRILMTGRIDAQLLEDAINRSEVFRFISKPWNPEVLEETLQQCVQLSGQLYNHSKNSIAPKS